MKINLNARPNNNGNTVEHFSEAFHELNTAEKALRAAIVKMQLNVVHGRNYQHLQGWDARLAYQKDDEQLSKLRAAVEQLEQLKLAVVAAIQPERN